MNKKNICRTNSGLIVEIIYTNKQGKFPIVCIINDELHEYTDQGFHSSGNDDLNLNIAVSQWLFKNETYDDDHVLSSSDIFYDLTSGGYLNIDHLLSDLNQKKIVNDALLTVIDFVEAIENHPNFEEQ